MTVTVSFQGANSRKSEGKEKKKVFGRSYFIVPLLLHFLHNSISSKLGKEMKIKILKENQQVSLSLSQV